MSGDDDQKFALTNTFTHSTATHDFEIRWARVGNPSRPPLVFVHGTPWSSVVWRDLITALEGRYCVYIYDHPGFEDSPCIKKRDDGQDRSKVGSELEAGEGEDRNEKGSGKVSEELDPTLKLRASASAELIRSWNLREKPHVVAHDNGGLVTLRLILEHGLKFQSVLFFDVVAVGPFGSSFFDLVAQNYHVFEGLPDRFVEGFVRAYVRSAAFGNLSDEVEGVLVSQWVQGGKQGPARFLQEMLQAKNRSTDGLEGRYHEVAESGLPVKILWGKEDSWISHERGQKLGELLGAREFVIIPRAGHLMQFDQPSRLAIEVALWLASNDG